MSAIDILYSAHPMPPIQGPVGRAPGNYLNLLPPAEANAAIASLAILGIALNAPLTRAQVRQIARDPRVTELAKYACIMAWGGQPIPFFIASIGAPGLIPMINALFISAASRGVDFATTQLAAAAIPGLGISFYTKLIFFLRPQPDAFILDQWTAKSCILLHHPHVVRLDAGGIRADPATTAQEYEDFCTVVKQTQLALWQGLTGPTGADAEAAMFDRSKPDGFWRSFVRANFVHPRASRLLRGGAESLTNAFDYRSGYLIIRQVNPPRVFVVQIRSSCCYWELDDLYRLMLARARELTRAYGTPVTLVLPPGPCPRWFSDALAALRIDVETSNECGQRSPDSYEECEDSAEDSEGSSSTAQNSDKSRLCLRKTNTYTGIVNDCGDDGNLGLIKRKRSQFEELWLKEQLIDKIRALPHGAEALDRLDEPHYLISAGINGATSVGGTGYKQAILFPNPEAQTARVFLEQFFNVEDCT